MKNVAVVSMKGGTGKTTVAANVGSLLIADKDSRVLLMDFDPRNQLGLHFGMPITNTVGLAQATLHGGSFAQVLHRSLDRAPFLPFGWVEDDERMILGRMLIENPNLLSERLADPALSDFDFALIDTAPGPSVYMQHVLPKADLVLVVVLPDAASFATLPALQAQLERYCPPRPGFAGGFLLINGMEESKKLARDIRAAMAQQFGDQLLPFVIHHDQAVREALAFQRPVADQGQTCQAAADFRRLTTWVKEQLFTLRAADRREQDDR